MSKPHILESTDYEAFSFHELNRPIYEDHVKSLVKSIERNNYLHLNPIIVDKHYQIISGQHRFSAARRLGVPIFYIIADTSDNYILDANYNQRRTKLEDAIEFYIKTEGKDDYKILDKYHKEFKVPVGSIIALIGNCKHKSTQLVRGEFKLSRTVEETSLIMDKYRDLTHFMHSMPLEYKGCYKTSTFCLGFRKFIEMDEVEWGVFMHKLRINWTLLDCVMPNHLRWTERLFAVVNKRTRMKHIEEFSE